MHHVAHIRIGADILHQQGKDLIAVALLEAIIIGAGAGSFLMRKPASHARPFLVLGGSRQRA